MIPSLRECPRTQGVSTTDLVGRMLLMLRTHFLTGQREYDVEGWEKQSQEKELINSLGRSPWTGVSQFIPTTRKIKLFSEAREPRVSFQN
jgi:ethanolamine-phosphate cytidylyltransferase